MTGDRKPHDGSTSKAENLWPQASASVPTLDRKLSVELPLPRQIYTIGSTVSGLVHLGTKDHSGVQEVQVSLVCVVHTTYHRYYGGTTHDIRRETSKLLHIDKTLWSRADGDASDLPSDFPFHITIPEFGNDAKAGNPRAPLPPSFHPGRQTGWKNPTYGTEIGYIRYHIKVSVARKGIFHRKERTFCPFVFLPPSPPPPLFPTLPDVISLPDLDRLNDGNWNREIETTNLRTGIFKFGGHGQATLTLWTPQVTSFPRLLRIPFVLCLALQTRRVKDVSGPEPPKDIIPPAAQLNKASLHLTQSIQTETKGATQDHTKVIDKNATDNFLHDITPQEGAWIMKKAHEESYWEKGYIWRGSWIFNAVPNFATRQITWKYALVAEVPIKGLGNGAKLVSRALEVSSGVMTGANANPTSEADMLELPPDYFDTEGWNEDEGDDQDNIKKA